MKTPQKDANVRGSPQPWGYVHQKGVTSGDIRFIKGYNRNIIIAVNSLPLRAFTNTFIKVTICYNHVAILSSNILIALSPKASLKPFTIATKNYLAKIFPCT